MLGNPLNTFSWKILLFGLNPLSEIEVQKVKVPELEIEELEVGAGVYNEKFPGKLKVSDLECENLKVGITGQLDPVYQWLTSCQDFRFGSQPPMVYRKKGQLFLKAPDLLSNLKIWEFSSVWPKKISLPELDLKANELYLEKITFSVSKMVQLL